MKKILSKLKLISNNLNQMYFAISAIALTGLAMLIISFYIRDSKMQNVSVGLGTGLM